jgi:hypothetical protein
MENNTQNQSTETNQVILTKKCRSCNIEKTLDQFDKQKDCKLGVKNYCKACYKIRNAERYNQKTNDIIRQVRLYQFAHPGKYKRYQKNYRRKTRELEKINKENEETTQIPPTQ